MACIPPNPKRVGYIDPIHGPLDRPLYMGSHIHQQVPCPLGPIEIPKLFLFAIGLD